MLERRLEYQSLKTILQHMDANARFKISLHMPSIENVEKSLPLKIKNFFLDSPFTRINDSYYELCVQRCYPGGNAPQTILSERLENGPDCDFDEFGFPFVSSVLLPGDVSFQNENRKVRFDTEEDERVLRRELSLHEKVLELRKSITSRGMTVHDYLNSVGLSPFDEHLGEEDKVVGALIEDREFLPRHIEEYKIKLQPFECRRNNTKPPFTCYIQLSIGKGEERQLQRFEYNKKLFEASKQLNEFLYGDRTMPIRIGEFSYTSLNVTFRLPTDFRIQVQKGCLTHYDVMHKNFPLIVDNSESLNVLQLDGLLSPVDAFDHQIVRNATRLIINGAYEISSQRLVQVIEDLPNREICVLARDRNHLPEFHFTMIQSWSSSERQVGSSLWISAKNERTANDVLDLILAQCEKSRKSERGVTVDLKNSIGLEAYTVPSQGRAWMLKMNIVKV